MSARDGHVRVLPLHVANKIAAGEVVERPASVAKELIENSIDAGADNIRISITQGGRKLITVQDNGCGMTKDDAILSLERQATSKILDVDDIEHIDTLGFRGEAIPSIASVSRFSITTRRNDSDEGTFVMVNAGTIAEVRAAGSPVGTLVEVRDLFCNVPARRKFLRAYATEESHVKQIFTIHALAHPSIAFSLVIDGNELYRLASSKNLDDRVRDLFGNDFISNSLPLDYTSDDGISVSGMIERPNLSMPTRKEQYIFINGRPASASAITYALRDAYPHRPGDVRTAVILFLKIDPNQVDVNVHPMKREVRFRNGSSVKSAICEAISRALAAKPMSVPTEVSTQKTHSLPITKPEPQVAIAQKPTPAPLPEPQPLPLPEPSPIIVELPLTATEDRARPWAWFKFLAQSDSGYLLIETDTGIVTINPIAARERIVYERLLDSTKSNVIRSQQLLMPEIAKLSPLEFSRLKAAINILHAMGFQLEEFGQSTFKIDAVPQHLGDFQPASVLSTIAHDLSECGSKRAGERWREELIAKSIARSFAGASIKMTTEGATQLVEDLCRTRMPYICPRGKPVMIFTSTRELNRKFDRA